jgi:glyoxylase-like metal-dependent hydrolase (beta-lactamase superfamily II)
VRGLPELMRLAPVKVHVHEREAAGLKQVTGLSDTDLVKRASGDQLALGDVELRFLHTPGHTPGSQCFLVGDALVSGDTLFLQGCGRVDLPGGNADELYESLTKRLGSLPGELTLYPGHNYGGKPSAKLAEVRRTNPYLRVPTLESWREMMG